MYRADVLLQNLDITERLRTTRAHLLFWYRHLTFTTNEYCYFFPGDNGVDQHPC